MTAARLVPYAVALAVFLADRASKVWIERNVTVWDVWPVIPGLFNIIHTQNRGMAFSLLENATPAVRSVVLIGFAGAVLAVVAVMLWQTTPRLQRWALSLVMGGALGNMHDRILRGSVTDFLDFYIGEWHWATFNLADTAITVGAALLLLEMALARKPAGESAAS